MTSRVVSASVRSPKPVEPPRSLNTTVTVLRTAPVWVCASACAGEATAPRLLDVGVPHWSQNLARAASSVPQVAHRSPNAAPHALQKRAPSRFAAWHCVHSTAPDSVLPCPGRASYRPLEYHGSSDAARSCPLPPASPAEVRPSFPSASPA